MRKTRITSHFSFTVQERNGIFYLLLLIIAFQAATYFTGLNSTGGAITGMVVDSAMMRKAATWRLEREWEERKRLRPFNPNYLNDYKGYLLGLQPVEIDRFSAFRNKGNYVATAVEFQEVTGISDSLLKEVTPYFLFPLGRQSRPKTKMENLVVRDRRVMDINTAPPEDFEKIRGIGPVLAARIVKFRNRLGGFRTEEQLLDVYGLPPEVSLRAMESFKVLEDPNESLLDVNRASLAELTSFIYLNRTQAQLILQYRQENGPFATLDELSGILGIPQKKFERIKLYLRL